MVAFSSLVTPIGREKGHVETRKDADEAKVQGRRAVRAKATQMLGSLGNTAAPVTQVKGSAP